MNPPSSLLLTDLYQLTMLQGYVEYEMEEQATFEFFVRKLPSTRNFLLAAGLEQALSVLEALRFTSEELEWLSGCGLFRRTLVDYLEKLHFTGDVYAMPEGTVFFSDEPIVRVTAPLPQAQLVETRLINLLHFETLIASKAARSVLVAPGKLLVDFGLRRAHGAEAGLLAARASYLAGFSGTSAVQAAPLFGIPIYGTMAHSFIQAHDDETAAFERFAYANPDNVVLLIDTYDTEAGAAKVVSLAPRLRQKGISINGVRLDSGDLADHAHKVRRILDEGGLADAVIFASGNLDESIVRQLVAAQAPIDGFGIGTRMDTSADAPSLDCAYKLEEYGGRPRRKRSEGKATWPGRKQVYRRYDADGRMRSDILTVEDDPQEGEPLIQPVMRAGKRLQASVPLAAIREHARNQLTRLPHALQALEKGPDYPVHVSTALRDLAKAVDEHRL
ncbi:nicotinate phosphoribosyltransferase [Candidatus Methylomirabilis lanthanidiphila]|uniref:Nicotinate phosphoribosyltransferase n=1 Tax=Candidatus Methylomirabilis lanthanidiphila TaxID=2211376 RepID=A0A564ZKF9_9BACT|nr:nicotinate phosphoribosyltransferase [Candidatus Methylomirabilis lanthanidiphila]VUZ85820.1 nicotinate phosphoribosyltransferase [Candidatus Methylomirabilis lanthanidiphila]